ncbi:MAG TPA: hypothetical protein VMH91_02375 [Candidatus Paceibacterota bacterium]|nr:hypothetical protein [Candidatus Paceibacterota bacterium]
MAQVVFWALILISVIVAVFYMLRVRRAGAQNSMMPDGLTVGERLLVILTILFGGVIIVGSIYYYGWKKRFPLKARQVLHTEWAFIALILIVFFGGGYLYYVYVVVPNAQRNAQATVAQLEQEYPLPQAESSDSNPSASQDNHVQTVTPATQSPSTPVQPSVTHSPSATIDQNSLSSPSSTFTVTGTASNLTEVLIELDGTGSGNGGGTYPVINGRWTATLTGVSGNMGVVVYPPSGQGTPLASGRFKYTQ